MTDGGLEALDDAACSCCSCCLNVVFVCVGCERDGVTPEVVGLNRLFVVGVVGEVTSPEMSAELCCVHGDELLVVAGELAASCPGN